MLGKSVPHASLIFLSVFFLSSWARATILMNPWVPAFQGIAYTTAEADASEPRRHKVFAYRVDLADPAVEFFSTPSNGARDKETDGQTTTTFVKTYGVAVGINANFFSPVSTVANEPRELTGLAISRGEIVSPYESSKAVALLVTKNNQASIITSGLQSYTNYWTAVAGSDYILINGVPQLANCATDFCNQNPRSAVGISAGGRYLILMVIDGRQAGWSDGATLYETGQWLLRLGAWHGLNLDGGGSSALVKLESGAGVLLNRPSGGVQRVNGNHLGVFAPPIAPMVLLPPGNAQLGLGQSATFSVNAGGTTPLRYQWRFNGANLASATRSSYTRANAQANQFGYYTVVISNSSGSVTSAPAMLVCTNPPTPPGLQTGLAVSNGVVQIPFTADAGRQYTLETSTNLAHWKPLTNFIPSQTEGTCLDATRGDAPQRYYRLRWER